MNVAAAACVTCRAPRTDDLDVLAFIRNDLPTQHSLLAHPTPNSLDDVRNWIERRTSDPAALFFVIADEIDAAVGFAQIVAIDERSRRGLLGIAIDPRRQRRGYGRAALHAVLAAAEQSGRLDKIVLEVSADNVHAAQLYVEAGFRIVGTHERQHRGPDGWHDVVIMERFLAPHTLEPMKEHAMADPHDPKDLALIEKMASDPAVSGAWQRAFESIGPYRYSYNWTWLGRPIIQFPQDIMALQEIIWKTRPEVIVETGIAHGGSLIFSASMLALLGGERDVIGVDIDIRAHNRSAIESHPLASRITMIEGSSIDDAVVADVTRRVAGRRTMVILDSNHTADHVARELAHYAPLVAAGLYVVVLDTAIENSPADAFADRPWGRGNSPMTAVDAFLEANPRFAVDAEYDAKLLFTVAPRGYLRAERDR